MAFSHAQLLQLKTAILADPILVAAIAIPDLGIISEALNAPASPAFIVWKTMVQLSEVGTSFNGAELATRSTADNTRLQTLAMYLGNGLNPSIIGVRQFFDDIFSGAGGVTTRASLLALWKRLATRAEQILATGTGSNAVPALLTFEGNINNGDIDLALHTS